MAGGETIIVSSDKDLMQLIGPAVYMLDPIKGTPIGAAEVEAKFGVPPDKVIEVQALIGDAVDNVPGVPGIGPKNAAQLICEYGTVESVIAAIPAMKPSKRRDALEQHQSQALLSKRLVTLRHDAPLPEPLEALVLRHWDEPVLAKFLDANSFRSIKHRLALIEHPELDPAPVPAPSQIDFVGYVTVNTMAALRGLIAAAAAAGRVALDMQTDNRNSLHGNLVGLAIATEPGQAAYIPLAHNLALEDAPQLGLAETLAALAPLLADPAVLKIMHDAKYNVEVLTRAGAGPVALVDDTMLMSYTQDAGNFAHDRETLSLHHLQHNPAHYDTVAGSGRNRLTFANVPIAAATGFAAEAADVTLRLWQRLKPALRANASLALYELTEKKLIPILTEMELHGVMVDRADLQSMSEEFAARMAEIETDIFRIAGQDFNLGSPKQLGEVLFERMKLPGGKKSKAGAWGTDVSVLEALAEQGFEIAQRVTDWRQLSKLKSTYADALIGQIDAVTGRVHTVFQMANTTTGRISSTDPNLQNIPIRTAEGARIRKTFIAEPGHSLVSADYSQIELRLLAHVADIPALKQSFADGEDIHTRTASEVFNVPMAGMDAATRRRAKAINFGIIYGISAFGLARQLGIGGGEARSYIDAYFLRYPEIRAYMENTKEQARTHGYVLTPFGRRCWVPRIREKIPALRAYAERQAINAPLQGGAADIIKRAMVRLPDALREAGLNARLILQVHDELLFEAPDDQAKVTAAVAQRTMQAAVKLSVPLIVETGIGKHWGEAH